MVPIYENTDTTVPNRATGCIHSRILQLQMPLAYIKTLFLANLALVKCMY